MSLEVASVGPGSPGADAVLRIVDVSFPERERYSDQFLFRKLSDPGARLLSFSDGGEVVGMSYVVERGDELFILYLAVDPSARSRGYGGEMLGILDSMYPGHRQYLCIEPLVPCDDYADRLRRFRFYTRNGFKDTGLDLTSDAGDFHLLSKGGLDLDAYTELRWSFFERDTPYRRRGHAHPGSDRTV